MIGSFLLAVVLAMALAVIVELSPENMHILVGVAIFLTPLMLKGDQWASAICQRVVTRPSIKVDVDYRYLLGTENRELLKVIIAITGQSSLKLYVPNMKLDLEYESPKDKETFPLVEKTVAVDQIISKDKTTTISVSLKFVDQYFQNDVLESANQKRKLKLGFSLHSAPEVVFGWRPLRIPVTLKDNIPYDEVVSVDR